MKFFYQLQFTVYDLEPIFFLSVTVLNIHINNAVYLDIHFAQTHRWGHFEANKILPNFVCVFSKQ